MDALGVTRNDAVSLTPEMVVFVRDAQKQKKTLAIRNDGPKPLMIKMKSTLAGTLKMKPVYGRVDAKATTTIKLEFHYTPDRIAVDSSKQRINVVVEQRWNERRSDADRPTKHVPGEPAKERITVVLADAPDSSMSPRLFWTGLEKHADEEKPHQSRTSGTGHKKPKTGTKEKGGGAFENHAKMEQQTTDVEPTPATTKPETQAITKPETPATIKPETPATTKPETPATAKQETPATSKPETPATAKQETPATTKPETPATTKPETPATTKQETPSTTKPETPATTKQETPSTTKPETPATTKPETPATTKPETPATTKQETPSTTKPETPATIKPETPATTKQETPSTTKPETPATIKPETPQNSVYMDRALQISMPKLIITAEKEKTGQASGLEKPNEAAADKPPGTVQTSVSGANTPEAGSAKDRSVYFAP